MNMNYCMYEMTHKDLRRCLRDVDKHINDDAESEVSENEIEWFQVMVETFVDWLHDTCLLDDEGNLDEDVMKDVVNAMRQKADYPGGLWYPR